MTTEQSEKGVKPGVLVISDEVGDATSLAKLLGNICDVEAFHTAGDVCEILSEKVEPSLIFLRLPGEESCGYDVLQKIGDDPRYSHIPLIVIVDPAGLEEGTVQLPPGLDFITTPFEEETLVSRAQTHFEAAVISRVLEEAEKGLKEREELLDQSRQLCSLLLGTIKEGIIGFDAAGNCTVVNPAALAMLGYERDDLVGQHVHTKLHHSSERLKKISESDCPVCAPLRKGEEANGRDTIFWRKDGNCFPVLFHAQPLVCEGSVEGGVISFTDISGEQEMKKLIGKQSNFDSLTGLPNRRLFLDRLGMAIAQGRRVSKSFALLLLNLYQFKKVNETLGYDAGDELLRQIGQRIRQGVRESDSVARLDGDAFALILSNIAHDRDAGLVAKKLIDVLNKPFFLDEQKVSVEINIGIAVFPRDGDEQEILLTRAEQAMAEARKTGPNTSLFFTEKLNDMARARSEMEIELRRALKEEEFVCFYQPIVNIDSGLISHAEALIRWRHPEKGLMPPIAFLPTANETGLIHPMERWVVEQVARDCSQWHGNGLETCKVSINLDGYHPQFGVTTEFVKEVLDRHALDAERLIFEITETAMMENSEVNIGWMKELKELGIQILVDDFGTGYSSLAYLRRFPVDGIKIDREFISNMIADSEDEQLVKTICAMADNLNLYVVAEGVETSEQLELISRFKSAHEKYVQGYYFSKPLPSIEFVRFVKKFK
ncbi:MAG: EAL domain-containing protein [Thermodesulfobacteriota bacterium]